MHCSELTQFQTTSLLDAANTGRSTYLMVIPDPVLDPADMYELWTDNNAETDALVALGYLEEITDEAREFVRHHEKFTGRKFRAFKITTIGKAMFDESNPCTSVN